jgi:hypothetical protein
MPPCDVRAMIVHLDRRNLLSTRPSQIGGSILHGLKAGLMQLARSCPFTPTDQSFSPLNFNR